MFYYQGTLENVYYKPGTNRNGQTFPASYVYQVMEPVVVKDETRLVKYDIKASESFGKHTEWVGKTVIFPVSVFSQERGGLNLRIPDGTQKSEIKVGGAAKAA